MTEEKGKITVEELLRKPVDRYNPEALAAVVEPLFDGVLTGVALVDAVVEEVHSYVVKHSAYVHFDENGVQMESGFRTAVCGEIYSYLRRYIPRFITEHHRMFIVVCHARGMSSQLAVIDLIDAFADLSRLAESDAVGWEGLVRSLGPLMERLHPREVGWPEEKYGCLWRKARREYKLHIRGGRFTTRGDLLNVIAQTVVEVKFRKDRQHLDSHGLRRLAVALLRLVSGWEAVVSLEDEGSVLRGVDIVRECLENLVSCVDQEISDDGADALISVLEGVLSASEQGRSALTPSVKGETP